MNVFELFFNPMVKLTLASSAQSLSPEEEPEMKVQQIAGSSLEYWVQLKSFKNPVQVQLQPISSFKPSSHVSFPLMSPSPQIGVHSEDEVRSPPTHDQPEEMLMQSFPHPIKPSSQVSFPTTL